MKAILFKTLLVAIVSIGAVNSSIANHFPDPVNDDSLKAQMLRDWERAKVYTKEYLDAMPEDAINFKPTPEIRSFAEQMTHLAQGTVGLSSNGSGKARIAPEKADNKAALIKIVMDSYDYAIDGLKNLDPSKFGEVVKMGNFNVTRLGWFMKAFEHQTHHRGQTTVYLRLKGVTPPQEKLF
jgi:hypothetical protein